jgi:hypothetical protein
MSTDPRTEAADDLLNQYYDVTGQIIVAAIDAADRAAGIARIKVDDATVERGARAMRAHDVGSHDRWDDMTDQARRDYLDTVRAVLEGVVGT